ncbi:MAG TPA: hypothetical protein DCY58_06010 [Acetobacterium sp.]|jgi:hypothetical protein|nr:hypothetical protein [Acetobacterium sp.]
MSLYAGLDEFELSRLRELNFDPELNLFIIPQTPNIKSGFVIDESFDFGSFIYPIAGFFDGLKPLNLFTAFKKSNVKKKELPFEYKALILPAAMILISLVVFGVFFGLKYSAQKSLEASNAYISDANNQAEYLQATELAEEVSGIQSEISNVEAITAAISSNPNLGAQTMTTLSTMGNGVIALSSLDYDGSTGAIQIVAIANNEKEAARYIERLKSTGYFTEVEYTGYAEISSQTSTTTPTTTTSTTSTSSGFGFVAVAYLKAGGSQ